MHSVRAAIAVLAAAAALVLPAVAGAGTTAGMPAAAASTDGTPWG